MPYYLRFIVATLLLTALVALVGAQPQGQVPNNIPGDLLPAVGPPQVAVTEVKLLGLSGNNFRLQVKWGAQVPNTTKVESFRVALTINYASGAPVILGQSAIASAREAVLLAPNRGVANPPKSFQAAVETFFTGLAVQTKTLTGNFNLNQANGFLDGAKLATPSAGIVEARAANNGGDLSRFDVSWSFDAGAIPKADDIRFSVKGDFVYQLFQSGTPPTLPTINRAATLLAAGSTRQVQFSFPGTPKLTSNQRLTNIKATVTVTALIKIIQSNKSAPLTGNF